jgi:hypothetical protein
MEESCCAAGRDETSLIDLVRSVYLTDYLLSEAVAQRTFRGKLDACEGLSVWQRYDTLCIATGRWRYDNNG